jgi:hypothetical protein
VVTPDSLFLGTTTDAADIESLVADRLTLERDDA